MPKEFSRTQRLATSIQRELAELIQCELRDPRLPAMITITTVKLSRDFSYAKVYIRCLEENINEKEIISVLGHVSGYLRRELGKRIRVRKLPQLQFVYDVSIDYADRMNKLIKEARITDTPTDDDDIDPTEEE